MLRALAVLLLLAPSALSAATSSFLASNGVRHYTSDSAAPTVNDDLTNVGLSPGASVGSTWAYVNTTTDAVEFYICADAADGAAVWTQVGASSGGSSPTELGQGANLFASFSTDVYFNLPAADRGNYSSVRITMMHSSGDPGTGSVQLKDSSGSNIGTASNFTATTATNQIQQLTFSVPDGTTYADAAFSATLTFPPGAGGGASLHWAVIEGVP